MFNARFNLSYKDFKSKFGLEKYGEVQKYIDEACIEYMIPYTPHSTGVLEKSPYTNTDLGSGKIIQIAPEPYARYQYYGKLMISPTTGSSWALKGEKKILTDIDLKHNRAVNKLAGPFWFLRMKEDKKDIILKNAQEISNKCSK